MREECLPRGGKCGPSGQRSDEKSLRWLSAGLLQLSEDWRHNERTAEVRLVSSEWRDFLSPSDFTLIFFCLSVYSFVFYPLPVKLPFPFVWSWFYFLLLSVSFSVDVLVRFTCVWAQAAACSSFLLYFCLNITLSPFSGSGRRLNPSKGTVQVSFFNLKMKVECLWITAGLVHFHIVMEA